MLDVYLVIDNFEFTIINFNTLFYINKKPHG